ncbi:hypothetical protein BDY21DRAFT_355262 [Lineolata rhizophorae]|uniref:PD-(D/E)XK nuclease-like domain-containing protein n=1 Tax=Lineolata rhizophorae TaxID=578093 RepID=A0A6A6NQY5_9PEZI|nr:hypothetical protein BDY21DRAFT_355262 [Lineolata rhizophorae]
MPRRVSPRKKRRCDDDGQSVSTASPALDVNSVHFPQESVGSGSTEYAFSNNAGRRVRANSPSRELRAVYSHATPPIRFTTAVNEDTPAVVLELLERLPVGPEGVVPASVKDAIQEHFLLERIPEYAFGNASDFNASSEARTIFRLAKTSIQKARAYFEESKSEAPWPSLCSSVLEAAFQQPEFDGMVTGEDVQYSSINHSSLLPQVNATAVPTKKADLALAISNSWPAARPLYDAFCKAHPLQHLSQMSDPGVSRLVLPACVEAGEPGKSYLEASIQLGLWCFAGLTKLARMRTAVKSEAVRNRDLHTLDVLFRWTAIGMDWRLHVAYRDMTTGGVTVLGPLKCGGFQSVTDFFTLFKTAMLLAAWIKYHFWEEIRLVLENLC